MSGEQKTVDMQAWVGCIDTSVSGMIVAGCYDGTLKIASAKDLSILTSISAHHHSIRAMRASEKYILTGSKDHTVKCFAMTESTPVEVK